MPRDHGFIVPHMAVGYETAEGKRYEVSLFAASNHSDSQPRILIQTHNKLIDHIAMDDFFAWVQTRVSEKL